MEQKQVLHRSKIASCSVENGSHGGSMDLKRQSRGYRVSEVRGDGHQDQVVAVKRTE